MLRWSILSESPSCYAAKVGLTLIASGNCGAPSATALSKPSFSVYHILMCWKCKSPISQTEIYRSSTCEVCGADLHACKNCTFFAPGSHYDCHESVDEEVRDKEGANFCDFFRAKKTFDGAEKSKADDAAAKARDAFASLFGN